MLLLSQISARSWRQRRGGSAPKWRITPGALANGDILLLVANRPVIYISAAAALVLCLAVPECVAAAEPVPVCEVPRIGWALKAPKEGKIEQLYWATKDYTELWTTLQPKQPARGQPGVPNLLLVFSICFRGRAISSPQDWAELRVQVNRNFIPAMIPDPRLEIRVDGETYDLTAPAFQHWTEYPNGCHVGETCAYSAVLVDLKTDMIKRIAHASSVVGSIGGIPFELTHEQEENLERFVARIGGQ